ncbi:unannotated protein [freshwater metagenome]|uniref:Unannotated protein n=1 Tax=freshwater metagenome TaxID=449393 RepID=A0A6J7P4X7_9ZZZZ
MAVRTGTGARLLLPPPPGVTGAQAAATRPSVAKKQSEATRNVFMQNPPQSRHRREPDRPPILAENCSRFKGKELNEAQVLRGYQGAVEFFA